MMSSRANHLDDNQLAAKLRDVLAGGDATDTARLKTVGKLLAGAALRVADAELGAPTEAAPTTDEGDALTDHNANGTSD